MSLEVSRQLDAIGVETVTGHAVLTIADSWPWSDAKSHLVALQNKFNAYFEFIESGQVHDCYPSSKGRQLRINVVFRFRPPAEALTLLAEAAKAASQLDVLISHETFVGKTAG
jgi:hypothetical protein